MNEIAITEEVFRRNKEALNRFQGFAQNVEALASLITQATGPVCTIATRPFTSIERQSFLAKLCNNGWSARIGSCKLHVGGKTYLYDTFEVRNFRKQAVTS